MTKTEDLLDLLSESAVEIANMDSPENVVCQRLRIAIAFLAELERVEEREVA